MENDVLVSVAICTYNGGKYLEKQLNSILQQTYTKLELVIVDDRSTDETFALLQNYASKDNRIRLFQNKKNLGYIKNFEKAISLCTGGYIALADQDDLWELEKIALMCGAIGDSLLIYHDSEYIDEAERPMGANISDRLNMYAGEAIQPFLFYNCVSGHSMMFKKELVKLARNFNPDLHHDWWLVLVAAHFGKITYLDMPLVSYRQHTNSVIHNLNLENEVILKTRKIYLEINPAWLKQVATLFPDARHDVHKILKYHLNTDLFSRLKMIRILYKHHKLLFYIRKQKKSGLSRLNFIRKMCFNNKQLSLQR